MKRMIESDKMVLPRAAALPLIVRKGSASRHRNMLPRIYATRPEAPNFAPAGARAFNSELLFSEALDLHRRASG